MVRAARVFEWLVLLVAGCLLAWLLLLPPFIGIADNRDFAKVLGRFCLGPAPGPSNYFLYFEPDYVWNQAACWLCEVRSSELGLAAIAVAGSKLLGGGLRFDIRWLGAVHAVLFLLALAVALRATRAWPLQWRTPFAGLLLVIYLDVCYSAYFNSVYTDAAAILGFLLALAAAAALLTRLPGRWSLACFTFGMLLFAGSKAQHALTGPLAAAFLLWMAKRHRPIRLECAVSAAVILGVSVFSVAQTPKWYRGQALFNAVFFQIAKESPNPARTLSDLRLDSSYLAFVGRHAFMQETSALSNDWMARFSDRLGHGGLAGYYLRHPGLALRHLDDALRMEAPVMRPVNLSNFRRVDGQAAGARTSRLSLWSGMRGAMLSAWPRGFAALYGLLWVGLAIAGGRLRRLPAGRLALLGAVILTVGVVEFGVAALADACETYRHLLLFHLMTDSGVVLGVAVAGMEIARRRGLGPVTG